MIAWMLYTALAGVLIAGAAIAIDRVARLAQRATRWVWVAAMASALGLTGFASRPLATASAPIVLRGDTAAMQVPAYAPPLGDRLEMAWRAGQAWIAEPIISGIAAANRRLPASAPAFALGAWLVASGCLALLFLIVQTRFIRARTSWPVADVNGTRVRVAPNVGPVVIGLVRPEIVMPRWLLDRGTSDQCVVIAHEAEHVRARDGLLIAGAWITVVLMPWNIALWFMLSRLRLAIELDCDARVLRGGVAPRAYGNLLIDLAERAVPLRLATTALSDDSSHLHQRILAMKPQVPRFAFARAGVAVACGFAALVAACATALPTDADIQKMDATSAESAARKLLLVSAMDSNIVYTIDGKTVTGAQAKALDAQSIATVNVAKAENGRAATMDIRTKEQERTGREGLLRAKTERDSVQVMTLGAAKANGMGAPIVFIDGARVESSAIGRLNKTDIESVEVLKGEAAFKLYGPDAANGVITIRTKAGKKSY